MLGFRKVLQHPPKWAKNACALGSEDIPFKMCPDMKESTIYFHMTVNSVVIFFGTKYLEN